MTKNSLITLLTLFLVGGLTLAIPTQKSYAQSVCSSLAECQQKEKEYQEKLTELSAQKDTLSNQVAKFDLQISLTEAKIAQTEEKIKLLGGRIDQLEGSLSNLNDAFSTRALETYKMSRISDVFSVFSTSDGLNEALVKYHYLKRIQEADRELLVRLQTAQNTYKEQKTGAEELQVELEDQQKVLGTQKEAKATLLVATKNDERKYQDLLSQARAQISAFSRFVTSQGGATILSNQTKCDSWGCYYNQRDSQWGNIGLGGSSYSVAEYGCLVTSVSMVASHYGKSFKPGDIASNSNYFVPGTGYLYHTADGMPFSITSASASLLDSQLQNGPVIAGLFSGPDHFIVILRKEGDDYIMHDPFLENGGNRKLSEKYSVSNISSLRLVNF